MICPVCKKNDTKGNRVCEDCFVVRVTGLSAGKRMKIDFSEKARAEGNFEAEMEAREKKEAEEKAKALEQLDLEKILALPISMLELKLSIINRLYSKKIATVGDLLQRTQAELCKLGYIGDRSMRAIFQSLERFQAIRRLMRG